MLMQVYEGGIRIMPYTHMSHDNKDLKVYHIGIFDRGHYDSNNAHLVGSPGFDAAMKSAYSTLMYKCYVVSHNFPAARMYALTEAGVIGAKRNIRRDVGRLAQKCSTQDLWCHEELLLRRASTPKK